jgi:hypothetical protein
MNKDRKKLAQIIVESCGSYLNSRQRIVYAFIMLAFLASLLNIIRAIHCGQNTGCVDTYWANFWLISYSDGYTRRALLGQILRFFTDQSVSYVTLNVISIVIVICVLSLEYYVFFSKISKNKAWPIIFLVLVSGPASTVFFEVLGDPLHVAMGLTIGYFLVVKKVTFLSRSLSMALAFMAGLIVVMIHEAAIFLFLPSIYLIYSLSVKKRPGYLLLAFIMVLLTIGTVLFLNTQEPNSSGMALLTTNSTEYFPPSNAMPPFIDLLKYEFLYYFGSAEGPIRLILKVLGSFLWPVMILLAIGNILKTETVFRIFIYLLLPSLPLYVIAHDWGRFAIYTLCLSFVLYGIIPDRRTPIFPYFVNRISEVSFRFTRFLFGSMTSMVFLLLVFYSHPSYRIDGLTKQSVILVVISIMAFILSSFLKTQNGCINTMSSEKSAQEKKS